MHYIAKVVYKVTSGNAINLLGAANASDLLLVPKQVLICQRDE